MKKPCNYRFIIAAAFAMLSCGNIQASGVFPGTILGVFSNPVLTGSIADDPVAGQSTYVDNTTTAIKAIVNSADPTLCSTPAIQCTGSLLLWGYSSSYAGQGDSEVIFFGAPIPSVGDNTPFQIGTLTYSNGTSDLPTLIFGVTLSFYDNVVSPSSFLGSDQIIITTTNNVFGSAPGDDDYLNFCGPDSTPGFCNVSIEAAESAEGGSGITVYLYGEVVGDPTLQNTSAAAAPGQTGTDNGFIGSDPPTGELSPEPGTWTTLGGALALGLGLARRRLLTNR